MKQTEFFPIASPCRRICTSNRQGICIGCLRSRNERLHWLEFDEAQKREILQKCARRMRRYQAAARKKAEQHPSLRVDTPKNSVAQSSLPLTVTESSRP